MPPAIHLPQLPEPLKQIVAYPAAPANPPTIADVAAGIKLSQGVLSARRQYCHSHGD
jgi:hypothetical protein